LENHLKSWTPRAPSPALRARFFGRGSEPRVTHPLALGWLAPASALLLTLFVTFVPRDNRLPRSGGAPGAMMAMSLSNQSMAAYLPGSFRGQRNHLAAERLAERFGWTKPGASLSSTPSFTRFQTNDLTR